MLMSGFKLKKLRKMGITEMAYRSRQEISKWLERVGPIESTNDLSPVVLGDLDRFQENFSGRFFAGAVAAETPAVLRERLTGACDEARTAAETICQKRFDLLGYRKLNFGDPVDWHLDPVSGHRSPLVHWSRLNPLDFGLVGDSKVVWELNRHQWLVQLGQAYRLTGDERYGEMFSSSVQEWMKTNHPGMGINWASSLEVAFRLISWCWTLFLFQGSKALSQELFVKMMGGIWSHASHVEKYLSYYFSPNTHLTGEALGLFYAGVLFPELKQSEHWRAVGTRILVEQINRQVLPDGVYFEQATCYQRYTVEIYLHFLILAERNGVAVPAAVRERVQRMLDFLLEVRHPDGSMPLIGDADGGWTLPLAFRKHDDLRGIFSTAAALWGRPGDAWAAGGLAPETLWLLGPESVKAFEALHPAPPATSPSRIFADGGYAVMRSGWEADAHQMIFDVGPLGCPVSGGHGHADLLSIQCAAFGEPLLVDPGMYCYTSAPEWRNFFRSTAAHSTVIVDGTEQAVPTGPFQWEKRPQARLNRWISTEKFDFADATHDAYLSLPDPVIHRRRVLFVKPRYWIVLDDLEGAAEHSVQLRFQFTPLKVALETMSWARARGHRGQELLIRPFALVPLEARVHEGDVTPIQGWFSPSYGQCQPAPVLIYSTVTRLPLRIMTLLLPRENAMEPIPIVSPILDGGPGLVGLIFSDGNEKIIIRDQEIILNEK
jgi:hypothetical protein